jgi:hypothetical protein
MEAVTVMNHESLEQRAASALTDKIITSTTLAELISDIDAAIVTADAEVDAARTKALDPVQSPDPVKAHDVLQTVRMVKQYEEQERFRQERAKLEAKQRDEKAAAERAAAERLTEQARANVAKRG